MFLKHVSKNISYDTKTKVYLMIPIKLELKNFLSYGEPIVKVDFDHHSLICLSGKNGNGKSALLDAMTWALWGQARKVSGTVKADAGLIRLGHTRMMVIFEFLCGGQRYRVRREYAKTFGKPYAALDIELFNSSKKTYRSLSEKKIRDSQAKIEKIVGLDFETFVNSVFLRQGQSNEFSKKTPRERKQILSNVLGLSKYDDLSKRALEHMRKHNEACKVLQKIKEQVSIEFEQEKECERKLGFQKKEIKDLTKKIDSFAKEIEKIEREKLLFLQKKYAFEQLLGEKKKNIETKNKKEKDLKEKLFSWKKNHTIFLGMSNYDLFEKERKKLVEQERDFRKLQEQEIVLQQKIIEKKEVYHRQVNTKTLVFERAELEYRHFLKQIEQKEEFLKSKKSKQKEFEKEIRLLKKELDGSEKFQKEFAAIKEQFEKRRVFYQGLVQRGNWARRELGELARKKMVVNDTQNPSCPLCEQVLTLKRKKFLARTLVYQEDFLNHRIDRVSRLMKKLKVILFEQHSQIQKLGFQNDRYSQLQANQKLLEKSLEDVKSEQKRESIILDLFNVRKNKDERELKILSKSLEDKEILEIKKELDALEKKKVLLKYDKNKHNVVVKQLGEYEKRLQKFQDIKELQVEQGEHRRSITSLCSELRQIKFQEKKLREKEIKLKINPSQEKSLEDKIKQLKDGQKKIGKEKEKSLLEKGRLENSKARFAQLKKEQVKRDRDIDDVSQQAKEYQVLSHMFGKDGIQALLIEQAIPEIEQEANELLSKLTDNKSQIFIESLRDLKKGGVRESLDIHISDAFGIRPYEMFSGGEAFRIDFSLRIAISKLLARRAGTSLQTLIIDEGFGSQDEEGLQRLMDSIYAIQKDFVKIIVVSHLPIFKNNFPVHFIVGKNSLGSFVRVEERG
jgi:exonuclease SbcC